MMVELVAKFYYRISGIIFICIISTQVFSQTEFDSLKRNSNLDSSYQPSSKPTFVTDYAEVKISGFIQPAFYFDYNNIFDIDLFAFVGKLCV